MIILHSSQEFLGTWWHNSASYRSGNRDRSQPRPAGSDAFSRLLVVLSRSTHCDRLCWRLGSSPRDVGNVRRLNRERRARRFSRRC